MERVLTIIGAVLIFPLFADEYTLKEVVVTGTRTESLLSDVPAFVSVVKIENQEKEGLLESSPGVNVNSYGAFGDTLSLSIRGSSSDQVLVLLDGMRLGSGTLSGISFLSLEGAERIEVFRGGASTLYGADAVGGVVNIITKKPTGNYFNSTFSYGSFNTLGASAFAGVNSEDSSMSIGAEHRESDGNFRYRYRDQELTRENNGVVNDAVQFKTDQRFSLFKFNLLTRFEMQRKEVPGSYFTPTPKGLEKDSRSMTLMGVQYNTDSTRISFNSSFIYHNLFYYDEIFVKSRAPSISDNFTTQNYFKIDTELRNNLVSISPEIRTEFMRSSSAGRHSRTVLSLFLQDEAGFFEKRLLLLSSMRFENYSDRKEGSIENAYRLGLRVKIVDPLYVKANTGSSFRVPTFLDLYWPEDQFAKGNPHLVPERGMDFDAGLGWSHGWLRGEIAYFYNSLKNLIQWAPDERGKWTPSNIGRAELSGVEFQMSGEVRRYFTAEISYTNLRALDLTKGKYYKNRLIYRPENILSVRLKGSIHEFKPFIEAIYNSWKYTDRENNKDNRLPGYYRINLGLSSPSFAGFSIEFLVNNLTDRRYEEVPGYPQPGRNFMVNLNYKI